MCCSRRPPLLSAIKALGLPLCLVSLALLSPGAGSPTGINASPALENPERLSDKCWIFMHLQKSGGSTIKAILRGSWGPRYTVYDSGQWKEGDELLEQFGGNLTGGEQWNVIAGGYPEALRRSSAVDAKCQWFTLFRHPVSRMVSAYYYCKRTPKDRACASEVVNANEVDLVAFAKHWGNFAVRQLALSLVSADDVMGYSRTDAALAMLPPSAKKRVRMLPGWYLLKMYLVDKAAHSSSSSSSSSSAGYGRTRSNTSVIPDVAMYEMLQPVQDLLRDRYDAVGILEEFNTTLSLFDAALAMPGVDWHEQFASEGRRKRNDRYSEEKSAALADAWTNSEIKKYMQLDIVLYEHAVDVFRQQAQAHGI